jgi:hypothetical protein
MRHLKLFEEFSDLPLSIDISIHLEQLKELEEEWENYKDSIRDSIDVPNDFIENMKRDVPTMSIDDIKTSYKVAKSMETNESQEFMNKHSLIEDEIRDTLMPIIDKYCEIGDFVGAKKFVGKSYKGFESTPGKVLLFRDIILKENEWNNINKNSDNE